jgi:hydrogenase expression/formation protein HypE
VQAAVRAGLALLGIDPLEVANEGVMLIAIPTVHADALIQRLQQHPLGVFATQVGRVVETSRSPLVMTTTIGGERSVPWPEALGLPRIC